MTDPASCRSDRGHYSSSSAMINRAFGQLGVRFVKDRTSCSLAACGIAVCPQAFVGRDSARTSRLARRKRGLSPQDTSCGGMDFNSANEACAVCSDTASGRHYGAVTCDSCKVFFEHSVRDRHIYDCHFSRACDLRLLRRNHCQGCRWDKCLDAGMIVSAVSKTRAFLPATVAAVHSQQHTQRQWTRQEAEDLLQLTEQSSSQAETPRPSLPSPTDTEGSQFDAFWDDDAVGRTLTPHDLLALDSHPHLELPIAIDIVRNALIPLESPEGLAARLTDLERSCLAGIFRWNKRRLERRRDRAGSFGAAASNWTPILLASTARHFLAAVGSHNGAAPAGESLAGLLVDRLKKRLLQGREFEFEPLLDRFEPLVTLISSMCSQLMSCVIETRRDVIRDAILLMGDEPMDELRQSLLQHQVGNQESAVLRVLNSLAAAANCFSAAQPEQRALLLAALVSNVDSLSSAVSGVAHKGKLGASTDSAALPDVGELTEEENDSVTAKIPILFGL